MPGNTSCSSQVFGESGRDLRAGNPPASWSRCTEGSRSLALNPHPGDPILTQAFLVTRAIERPLQMLSGKNITKFIGSVPKVVLAILKIELER